MIQFKCPSCGLHGECGNSLSGFALFCKKCQFSFTPSSQIIALTEPITVAVNENVDSVKSVPALDSNLLSKSADVQATIPIPSNPTSDSECTTSSQSGDIESTLKDHPAKQFSLRKCLYLAFGVFGVILVSIGAGRAWYRISRINELENIPTVGYINQPHQHDRSKLADAQLAVHSFRNQSYNALKMEKAEWDIEEPVCVIAIVLGGSLTLLFGILLWKGR